mmetsp:Transcript_11991/g.24405  ORF Transcript_11991/g.24405 Transcript_11991/m.24405 type:complete len:103 (+) Transcript_11991:172-480(+)
MYAPTSRSQSPRAPADKLKKVSKSLRRFSYQQNRTEKVKKRNDLQRSEKNLSDSWIDGQSVSAAQYSVHYQRTIPGVRIEHSPLENPFDPEDFCDMFAGAKK